MYNNVQSSGEQTGGALLRYVRTVKRYHAQEQAAQVIESLGNYLYPFARTRT